MDIVEAIKSGNRFRRNFGKGNVMTWLTISDDFFVDDENNIINLHYEDILAEDWEVEE